MLKNYCILIPLTNFPKKTLLQKDQFFFFNTNHKKLVSFFLIIRYIYRSTQEK